MLFSVLLHKYKLQCVNPFLLCLPHSRYREWSLAPHHFHSPSLGCNTNSTSQSGVLHNISMAPKLLVSYYCFPSGADLSAFIKDESFCLIFITALNYLLDVPLSHIKLHFYIFCAYKLIKESPKL